MTKKSPAFQFYTNDFLGSGKVGTMSTEELGMYTLLLCLEWNEIGFEFDDVALSTWCRLPLAKFRRDWKRVSRCFVLRDGRMYNPRLDLERERQADWREKSRKGGIASGEARSKGGSTTLPTKGEPKGNTQSQSQSVVTTKATTSAVAEIPKGGLKLLSKPDCDSLFQKWGHRFGALDYGRFRKAVIPVFQLGTHTPAEVLDGMEAAWEWWIEQEEKEQGFFTLEKFVSQVSKWVTFGKMPLTERGVLTERGSWAGSKSIRQEQRRSA